MGKVSGHLDGGMGRALGGALFLGAMALGGSSVPVSKRFLAGAPVFLTTFCTLAVALAGLAPLWWPRRRELRGLGAGALGNLVLQGLFGVVLFRVFLLYGLRTCGGWEAGVLAGTTPAAIAVLATLVLGERPGGRTWAAVACAVCGAAAVNLAPGRAGNGSLVGAAFVLAAVFSEALLTILRKSVGTAVSAVTNTTVLVAACALLTAPLAAAEYAATSFAAGPGFLAGVVYHGLVATDLGYLCFMAGAARISASTAGVLSAALPVSAAALSTLLLDETLGWPQLAGCALVGAGVAASAFGRPAPPRTSPSESRPEPPAPGALQARRNPRAGPRISDGEVRGAGDGGSGGGARPVGGGRLSESDTPAGLLEPKDLRGTPSWMD